MSKEPKLTEFFEPDVTPSRVGVYEVAPTWTGIRWFRYWDGSRWHVGGESPAIAAGIKATIDSIDGRRWRGLAEPSP